MDLLRRTAWLRMLTVLLLGLGSTAVAAQPHGPAGELSAGASSDGTVSEAGFSLVVTSNAVGLLVDAVELGGDLGAAGSAEASPGESPRTPRTDRSTVRPRTVPLEERPLRHRLCVYRL